MSYTVASLKQDIRRVLDQNSVDTQLLNASDVDTMSLDDLIESKIVDAVRYVCENAPLKLFDSTTVLPDNTQITWEAGNTGVGSIALPSNFLRLAVFKMSDWDRPAFIAINETDPLYAVQRSSFLGVKGNTHRPVVAIIGASGQVSTRRLEFYTCSSNNATISKSGYIPVPAISNGNIDICTLLKSPAVYYAAFLVAESLGENDRAQVILGICNEMIK